MIWYRFESRPLRFLAEVSLIINCSRNRCVIDRQRDGVTTNVSGRTSWPANRSLVGNRSMSCLARLLIELLSHILIRKTMNTRRAAVDRHCMRNNAIQISWNAVKRSQTLSD